MGLMVHFSQDLLSFRLNVETNNRAQPTLEILFLCRVAGNLQRTKQDAVRAVRDRRPIRELGIREGKLVETGVVVWL